MDIAGDVGPEFGFAVVHRKGAFCSSWDLLKRSSLLDSSREVMQFRLFICLIWSSDDFWIAIGVLGFSGAGPTSAFLFEESFAAEEVAVSSVTENHEE